MRLTLTILVVLVAVIGFVALVQALAGGGPTIVQPIAFNHFVHLETEMQCIDCHTDAESARHAGLPGKDICYGCHDVDDEDVDPQVSPEKAKLFSYVDSDDEIPWLRIAVTRPDVYFSHRRHVTAARMECLDCHAGQPTLTAPPSTAQLVMTMTSCIDCHQEQGATADCLACHR